MKKLLFALLLLATIKSNGQYYAERKAPTYYDTASVWLTVTRDTSQRFFLGNGITGFQLFAIKAYVVNIHEWVPEHQSGDAIYMGEMVTRFYKYLDAQKRELPKNILILN